MNWRGGGEGGEVEKREDIETAKRGRRLINCGGEESERRVEEIRGERKSTVRPFYKGCEEAETRQNRQTRDLSRFEKFQYRGDVM